MSRVLLDFNPEAHGAVGEELLFGKPTPPAQRSAVGDELEELDLASRLLEAKDPASIARLVDGLVRRAPAGRPALSPPIAAALGAQLARVAQIVKAALPRADETTPTRRRTLSVDTIFGTELEGLSAEDREFEAARRFVRFALATVANATRSDRGRPPAALAASATTVAAMRHAPGLLSGVSGPQIGFRRRRA
jgi:hypothetical protein